MDGGKRPWTAIAVKEMVSKIVPIVEAGGMTPAAPCATNATVKAVSAAATAAARDTWINVIFFAGSVL
jgi:nitrogenase subunit NifH